MPFYRNGSDHYWKIIIEHISKLQALNLPVNSSLKDTILSRNNFKNHFARCTQELLKAKETKLGKSWVTCLNLLTDNMNKLVKYAGNENLVKHFQNLSGKRFKVYGGLMKRRFTKAIRVRKMWDASLVILSNHLPVFNPTHLILRNVVDCLNKKELIHLSK